MEIQGTLKQVHPVIERGEFKSRKIWLTTADNPEYPQTIEIEVNQAKIGLFDGVSVGAPITCSCNLRGREWTDPQGVTKVFNTIVCWKVTAGTSVPVEQAKLKPHVNAAPVVNYEEPQDTSDLPF